MKKVSLMIVFSLISRMLVAQELDLNALAGESWYGLYWKGHKSGYLRRNLELAPDGSSVFVEEMRFQVRMAGREQDISNSTRRVYGPDRALQKVETNVKDAVGAESNFVAVVEGDQLRLQTIVGGDAKETILPRPDESLDDAFKQVALVQGMPEVGKEMAFTVFDPLFQASVSGVSRIAGKEERVYEGAPIVVYKVKTTVDLMPMEVISYVAQDGTVLEDIIANMITMRLEPKELAQNVEYINDTVISNAVRVAQPIANPRERESLKLRLRGSLSDVHLFNDERQFLHRNGDGFDFAAMKVGLEDFKPAQLPINDEDVAEWLKPTTFVQSDNPLLIDKVKEIIGDETDALKVNERLTNWVSDNVRTTYSARLTNALEVLTSLEGDCTEHSILFVGLARAAGLPAREVAGLVYVEGENPGFYFHQWAKVWIGKWIDVDPTFNQPIADVTHIKLAEGDLYEQQKLIPVIGQISIEVVEPTPAT